VSTLRVLAVVCAMLMLALAPLACATMTRPGGSLQIQCNVPDAAVFVDDVLVGRAAEWAPPGKALRPGFHRVEVRHPSYFSHYAEVELADGGGALVKADLHPLLD
jgi:hypothetical protein